MFPLLPALILLLLQGPSNFERLAVDSRLPAALEAMQIQRQSSVGQLSESEQRTLASLLAAGCDQPLSQAILAFLGTPKSEEVTPSTSTDSSRDSVLPATDSPPAPDGFSKSQRTRDGPLPIGIA